MSSMGHKKLKFEYWRLLSLLNLKTQNLLIFFDVLDMDAASKQ